MIDPATLAEWEQDSERVGVVGPLLRTRELFREIRRLRAILEKQDAAILSHDAQATLLRIKSACLESAEKEVDALKIDLAAHRAVVRELAILLDASDIPDMANEGDLVAWHERLHAVLTDPLVVAEWEGGGK